MIWWLKFASEFSGRVRIRIRIRSCIAATAVHSVPNSDDSSQSVELLPSEEELDEEEYYTNSEEGFPNIQRVSTYPARLTEEGGVERIGPVEVISEADPSWQQLDQDQWFAHRSDSDYKVRACAHTAASISLPASTKDSWEWPEDHAV